MATRDSVGERTAARNTRVVIADDHAVVRNGLELLLDCEPELEVVAEAHDMDSARRRLSQHVPDVLTLDLNMAGKPSLPAIPELREDFPDTAVVVLTMQNGPAFAREALSAGALGYVLKEGAASELVPAIRMAASGRTYLSSELGPKVAGDAL